MSQSTRRYELTNFLKRFPSQIHKLYEFTQWFVIFPQHSMVLHDSQSNNEQTNRI